jgi:hypothetical protein
MKLGISGYRGGLNKLQYEQLKEFAIKYPNITTKIV